jgi:hypothetical protein
MSKSQHRSCQCGAVYNRTQSTAAGRQISSFECSVCSATMGSWKTTWMPTYRLVAGPVRALSDVSISGPFSCESPAIVPGDRKYMLLEGKLDFEVMPDTSIRGNTVGLSREAASVGGPFCFKPTVVCRLLAPTEKPREQSDVRYPGKTDPSADTP